MRWFVMSRIFLFKLESAKLIPISSSMFQGGGDAIVLCLTHAQLLGETAGLG